MIGRRQRGTRIIAAAVAAVILGAFGQAAAVIVSGQVTNELGAGIVGVDLDFQDRSTGIIIPTPGDDTGAGGFYVVNVPAAEYDIFWNPPIGTQYLMVTERHTITTTTTIDILMPLGYAVTGRVTSTAGVPLANVDLDFYDVAQGQVLDTPNDNTDAAGYFTVLVPAATYDVRFTPPLGLAYAGHELTGVVVTAATALGTIQLQDGLHVTGRVTRPDGSAVAGTDLDFIDVTTGEAIFTPRDNTSATGTFDVLVPAGTYDVEIAAPAGSGLAYRGVWDVVVSSAVDLGTIQLATGYNLTGTVRNQAGVAMAGADLDMIDRTTQHDLPTANDNTDAAGAFLMTCPAETIDLVVKPPTGVDLAATVLRNRIVSGPLAFGLITLEPGFRISGTVKDHNGAAVYRADIDAYELVSGLGYPTPQQDLTGPIGSYNIRLPGGSYLLIARPPAGSTLQPDTVVVNPLTSDRVIHFVLVPDAPTSVPPASREAETALFQNMPNPFAASTAIRFRLAVQGDVELAVFTPEGRRVRTLVSGMRAAGEHMAIWDGDDDRGAKQPAGVYFYRLEGAAGNSSRKMLFLR